MYSLIAPLLFALPAETSHDFTIRAFQLASNLRLDRILPGPATDPVERLGLRFPNRVGLAAGLDKNADAFEMLGALGFGFVEVGTVTPRPQPGNPGPRLFRIPERGALINRMGFNNFGLDHLLRRVADRRYAGVLGINLGKNRDTPTAHALEDYARGLHAVHAAADYVTINLSSPNTPGLRDLQTGAALENLLVGLAEARDALAQRDGHRTPLLVKVAPDLHEDDLAATVEGLVRHGVDGIIATNTTLDRSGVMDCHHANEAGGLSGSPLFERSRDVVASVRRQAGDAVVIVGVGGVDSAERAAQMVTAGADLVQLYTGFIYRGPGLVHECVRTLASDRVGER